MTARAPTRRQHEVLVFIRDWSLMHSYPPTVRDIMRAFGFASPNAVSRHLGLMEKKGLISRQAGKARSIVANNGPTIETGILTDLLVYLDSRNEGRANELAKRLRSALTGGSDVSDPVSTGRGNDPDDDADGRARRLDSRAG